MRKAKQPSEIAVGPLPESVNEVLKEHSLGVRNWCLHEVIETFHQWAERFNREFDLGLQTPAIRIDRIPIRTLGTYHPGRNGFGLRHEVTLNIRHLDLPLAEQLSTLLHELLHEWQALYGKAGRGNYHNRQFRRKAALYGLIVDERGRHRGILAGKFTSLLQRCGVNIESLRSPDEYIPIRPRGHSKMRKWCCGCTTARAVRMSATCNDCGLLFEEAPPAW